MKVKIKNSKGLKFSQEPIVFDIKVKNNRELILGTLVLNFSKGIITLDVKRKLSREERLDVLKEIFDKLVYKQKVKYNVEKLKLKDVHDESDKNMLTIIEELLTYDIKEFNPNNNSEQIICEVNSSYKTISEGLSNGCTEIVLKDILSMSGISEEYERILDAYLQDHGKRGKLISSIKKIDEDNPYFSYYIYLKKYTYYKI